MAHCGKLRKFTLAAVLAALCCTHPGARAGQTPPPDIGAELDSARKARALAEELGAKARAIIASGGSDISTLLDNQEKAVDQATEAWQAALTKDPTHPRALAGLGRFWMSRGRFDLARPLLEKAVRPPRASQLYSPDEEADLLRDLAAVLERAGDDRQAIACLRTALQKSPKDPRNLISLAVSLNAAGNPAETRKLLKPAVTSDDLKPAQKAYALHTLAAACEEIGYWEEALDYAAQCEKVATSSGDSNTDSLAELAVFTQSRLEILIAAEKSGAATANPNPPPSPVTPTAPGAPNPADAAKTPPLTGRKAREESASLCERGAALKAAAMESADFQNAIAEGKDPADDPAFAPFFAAMRSFQEATEKFPRGAYAHTELGACNLILERYAAARSRFDAAALYSPNNSALLRMRGQTLLELAQWEDAAACFQRLMRMESESAAAHLGLARAWAGMQSNEKMCRDALDAAERAVRLGSRDPRLFDRRYLELKDGSEVEGPYRLEGDAYVSHSAGGDKKIPASELSAVREEPGIRTVMDGLIARYERGEPPPGPQVIKKSSRTARRRPEPRL